VICKFGFDDEIYNLHGVPEIQRTNIRNEIIRLIKALHFLIHMETFSKIFFDAL
jgi:hypothetical protein